MTRVPIAVTLLTASFLFGAQPLQAQTGDANLFPETTFAYFELSNPVELISTIFDHPLRAEIESLPPYQMALKTPQYQQFSAGLKVVESQLQMKWREVLETLLAKRVSIAVDGKTNGGVAIIHGKDAASMKMFHDKLLAFAKLSNKVQFGSHRDIKAFRIDETRVAVYEDRMLITNNSELGKTVIDRLLDGGDSLAQNPRFLTAIKSRPQDAAGWGFVDVEVVRKSGAANDVFEKQIDNPVAELLVGGIQSTLKQTPYATITLTANTESVGVAMGMPHNGDWIPAEREYFFGPSGTGRGPALPETSETLFTLSTYRNFSEMWLRAGDLFGAAINDGFAKADANLTTLFAGRDFGEDILGSFEPEAGFIATRQDFANVLPRPTIKLPAFAFVFELREPEAMTRELRRIFQSLIGFLNIVGAMNGQNQLEMDMEKIGDHAQLVTSAYVPEDDNRESTDANIVYNFSPSVGFAGKRFVVSSSASLARQLTLAKTPSPEENADNTDANLNAAVLRDVLADNREQLIAQNMLQDGNSREEAEAIIELLLQAVGYFQDATLRLSATDDQLQAEFNIQVQP